MADIEREFKGTVVRKHADGRHVFVEFEPPLVVEGKLYDQGWYDLANSDPTERKTLQEGARVKGKAQLNGSNLAVVEDIKKVG